MKYYYKFGNISLKEFKEIWVLYEKRIRDWGAEAFYKQALNSYKENVYLIFHLYNKVDKFYKKEYIIDGYCSLDYIKRERKIDNIISILPEFSLRDMLIADIKRIHNVEVL